MQFSGRIRHFDLLLGKPQVDRCEQIVPGRQSHLQARKEQSNFQLQRAVSDDFKKSSRLRILKHIRVIQADLTKDLASSRRIGSVSHTDVDDHPVGRIAEGPIQQSTGYKVLVGNHQFLLVEIHDRRGPHADFGNRSGGIPHGNDIPYPDGLFKEQDQPRDEIGKDLLETEPQAHAQGRNEPLDASPSDTEAIEGHRDTEHQNRIARDRGDRVADCVLKGQVLEQRDLEQTR